MSTGAQKQMADDSHIAIEWRHRSLSEKALRSWMLHVALLFQTQCEIADCRIARELRVYFDAWSDACMEQTVSRIRNSLAAIHGGRALVRSSFRHWTYYVDWCYNHRDQVREVQYRNALKVGRQALRAWKHNITVSQGNTSSLVSNSPYDKQLIRTPSSSSSLPSLPVYGGSSARRAPLPRHAAASSCTSSPLMDTRGSIHYDAIKTCGNDDDHFFSPAACPAFDASSSYSPSSGTHYRSGREHGIHTVCRYGTHLFRPRFPKSTPSSSSSSSPGPDFRDSRERDSRERSAHTVYRDGSHPFRPRFPAFAASSSCSSSPTRKHCGCLQRGGDTCSSDTQLHPRPLPRPHALFSSTSSRTPSLRQDDRLRQSCADDSGLSSILSAPRPHPLPSVPVSPSSSRANRQNVMSSAVWCYSTSCCSSDQKCQVPASSTSSSNASPACAKVRNGATTDRPDVRTPSYTSEAALDAASTSSSKSWGRVAFDPSSSILSPMEARHLPSPAMDAFIFTTANDNAEAVTISVSRSDVQNQGSFSDNSNPALDVFTQQQVFVLTPGSDTASLITERQLSAASFSSPSEINTEANVQQQIFEGDDKVLSAYPSLKQQHMCVPYRNSLPETHAPTQHQAVLTDDDRASRRVTSSTLQPPLFSPRENAESATCLPSAKQLVPPHISIHVEPSGHSRTQPRQSTARAKSPSEYSYASQQIPVLLCGSVNSELASAGPSSRHTCSPAMFSHCNSNTESMLLPSQPLQPIEKGSTSSFLEESKASGVSQPGSLILLSAEPEHCPSVLYTSLPQQEENGYDDHDDNSVVERTMELSCTFPSTSPLILSTTSLSPTIDGDPAAMQPVCGATPQHCTTGTDPSRDRVRDSNVGGPHESAPHKFPVENATPLCADGAQNAHLLPSTITAAHAFLGWRVACRLHGACVRAHLHTWHRATKWSRSMRVAQEFAALQRVLADARSEREAAAARYYVSSRTLHAFTYWMRFTNEAREKQDVQEREAAVRYSGALSLACFRFWQRAVGEFKCITTHHNVSALCRRAVCGWHKYCASLYANATAHHAHALLRVAFTAWHHFLVSILANIDKHAAHACMRTMFARWLDATWEPRFNVALQVHVHACLRHTLSHWQKVAIAGTLYKQQQHLAQQHFALTLLFSSMSYWQKYVRECAHVRGSTNKILLLRVQAYIRHWHVRSRRQAHAQACAVHIAEQRLTCRKRLALQRWLQRLLVERDVAQVQESTSLRACARIMSAWLARVSSRKAWRKYVAICAERITDRRCATALREWSAYADNERYARAIVAQHSLLRLRAHLNAWSTHYRVRYAAHRRIRRTATVCVASWRLYVALVRMRRTNARHYRRFLTTQCMSAWARAATLAPYLRALQTKRNDAWLRECLAAWYNRAICLAQQHHALAHDLWTSRIWKSWRAFVALQQLLRMSLQQWRTTTSCAAYERRIAQSSAYYATSLQRKVFASCRIACRTRAAAMHRLRATMNPVACFHTGANAFLAWRACVRVTCRREKMTLQAHFDAWRLHYRDQLGHHVLTNGRWSMMRLRRLLIAWRAACIDAGAQHICFARWGTLVASTLHAQQHVRAQACFNALIASRQLSKRAVVFRRAQLLRRTQRGLILFRSHITIHRRARLVDLRHKFLRFCVAVRAQKMNVALDHRADRVRSKHLFHRLFHATRIARAARAEQAVLIRKADGMQARRVLARFCRAVLMVRQDTRRLYAKMRTRQLLRAWRRVLCEQKRSMDHFEKRRQERFALHRIREIERRIAVVDFHRRRQTLVLHSFFRAWRCTHNQLLRLATFTQARLRTRRHHVIHAWHHAYACLRVVRVLLAARSRTHVAHVFRAWQHMHARLRMVRDILATRSLVRLRRFFNAWQHAHADFLERQHHLQSVDAKRRTRLSTYALLAWSHYCQVAQRSAICTAMITRHRECRSRVQCVRHWAHMTRTSHLARKVEARRQRRIWPTIFAHWVKAVALQRKARVREHAVLRLVAREWHVEASLQRRLGDWELCTEASRMQELLLWWRACALEQRTLRHKVFNAFRNITLTRKRVLLSTVSYARLLAKADKFRHVKNHCALRRYTRAWRDVGLGRLRYTFAVERLQGILRQPLHHWRSVARHYRVCNLMHLFVARQMWSQWIRGAHAVRVQQWAHARDMQWAHTTMMRILCGWHLLVRNRRHAVAQIATLMTCAGRRNAFHCLILVAKWMDHIRPAHLLVGAFRAWRRDWQLYNSACHVLWQWWRQYTAALKRVRKCRLRGVVRAFAEYQREKCNIRQKQEVAKAAFTRRVLWATFLVWQCRVDFIRQSIDTQHNFDSFSPASKTILSVCADTSSSLNLRYASPARSSMPTRYCRATMLFSSSPVKPLHFSPALQSLFGDSLILSSSMDMQRYEFPNVEWPLEKIEDVTECVSNSSNVAHSHDAKTSGSGAEMSARSESECATSCSAVVHPTAPSAPARRMSESSRSESMISPEKSTGVALRRLNDCNGSICCSGSPLTPRVPLTHDNNRSTKMHTESSVIVNHARPSNASSSMSPAPIPCYVNPSTHIPRERLFTSSRESVVVRCVEEVAPLGKVTSSRSDVLVSDGSDVRDSIEFVLGSTAKTRCDQILSWQTFQTARNKGKRQRAAFACGTNLENKENVTDNAI